MRSLLAAYELEDLVSLYAVGALAPGEADEFERRRADGWPEAEEMLATFTGPVADLAADVPELVPPPHLKAELLNRLAAAAPVTGYTILAADDTAFRPLPYPGVSMRLLHVDRARQMFSCLLRFAPGARLPAHPHSHPEECMVLDGAVIVAGVRLTAGDYQRVEAGVSHVEQWSDTGGTAFIVAPLELLDHH